MEDSHARTQAPHGSLAGGALDSCHPGLLRPGLLTAGQGLEAAGTGVSRSSGSAGSTERRPGPFTGVGHHPAEADVKELVQAPPRPARNLADDTWRGRSGERRHTGVRAWAHIRRSLASLAARALGDLETLLPCTRSLRL